MKTLCGYHRNTSNNFFSCAVNTPRYQRHDLNFKRLCAGTIYFQIQMENELLSIEEDPGQDKKCVIRQSTDYIECLLLNI